MLKTLNCLSRLNERRLFDKHVLSSLSMITSNRQLATKSEMQTTKGLPKLIVPVFDETIQRLKIAVKPFAKNGEELQDLYQTIDDFARSDGCGRKLHCLLEHKSTQTSNWLSHDWWINKAYLEGRDPVMIWSNPGLVFPELQTMKNANKGFVAQFISRLILSVIDYRNALKSGDNPEKQPKTGPICMDQFSKVFGTCRIPGSNIDDIRFGTLNSNEISIIISRFNKFYKLSLMQSHDKEATLASIEAAILHILSQTSSESIAFGSFSALPRNDFYTVYQLLNENALNHIIESEFVVNIDHIDVPNNGFNDNETYYKVMGKQSLYADINNIGNRWFDKTIQLICVTNKSGDRLVGLSFCYEHTPAEGGIVVQLMEHTIKHLMSDKTKLSLTQNTKLEELSLIPKENIDKIRASDEFSKRKYLEFINSIDLEILEFKDYGKEFVKSLNFSPDSWIQLAIALAFYKVHGKVGATYESGGTRMFAFGRTETIRSVTEEFAQFFKNPNNQSLKNAIDSHKIVAKNAVTGHGIDRLLLGYNCVAQEIKSNLWKWGIPEYVRDNPLNHLDYQSLDKLYTNDLYKRSKHFQLSTSQVASALPQSFMCYGPLVTDGYGCCYNPSKNQIIFAITSFKENNANTNALTYKSELKNCLKFMQQIVLKQSKL
ncbi:carnitine O-acetyltransferase-like [Oppia nitens]|uniref:carnitine O-acetyltransferase-like n=1 Tax=Oppia nitens TaxID=1686743 RepID=UPI0023DAF0F8|nr:carnitine O-acetyltransferase-like [Oppia nitens]